jgi:hypothetical protein
MRSFKRIVFLTSIFIVIVAVPMMGQFSSKNGLTLFGGLSIPVGKFSKTDEEGAGAAKKGWVAGGEYLVSLIPSVGIVLSGRYMHNPMDEQVVKNEIGSATGMSYTVGSFTGILPMAGVQVYMPTTIGIYVNAQAGYMMAKSPEITVSGFGTTSRMESASGNKLAYGVSAGLDIGNFLVAGASYIMTKPKFDMKTTAGTITITNTVEIEMNTIQVFAGIRF